MANQIDILRLRHGPLELDLCPEIGGCVTAFRHHGCDVLRPAGAAFLADRDPRQAASFPLVPFSNRIADGRFGFRGRIYQLARNFPPEPHAIHGHGWQRAWTVSEVTERRAVLSFACRIAGTPLDYRARQTFVLGDRDLEVTLEVTNAGDGPMPAGLGLHPYFLRSAGVTLKARLDHVWLADGRKIPQARASLPAAWDFAQAPRIAALATDHCFGGWDGAAELHWPESGRSLRIEAGSAFGHLVIYVPSGRDFFCVEPVSHANDGFNLLDRGTPDTGVRVLAAGETFGDRVRMTVC